MLFIDFETRSAVNLRAAGLHKYAADPTTGIWCLAFAVDDGPVQLLTEDQLRAPHRELVRLIDAGTPVYGHNVAFEFHIWNEILHTWHGWPPLAREQCYCTMAEAYAMGLPGGLDAAAAALQLPVTKSTSGASVMRDLSRATKASATPAKLSALYDYCRQDVEVERQLYGRMLRLSGAERAAWLLDQEINDRGVYIDLDAVAKGLALIDVESARLNAEMVAATDGAVGACTNVGQLADWLTDNGAITASVAKPYLRQLLTQPLPDNIRRACELRLEAGKSSTAKLEAMRASAGDDGRARGLFQYHAAHTGRWGGRRIQPQNLPRPDAISALDDIVDAVAHLDDREYLDAIYGPPLPVLSSCIRALLRAAPGHRFLALDFANIEGRVLAWLAGEEWKVQAFADFDAGTGPDIYLVTAGSITGKRPEESKADRQVLGKTPELALGFGGGVGAFAQMAKSFGIHMADHYDQIVAVAGPVYKERAVTACRERGDVVTAAEAKAWVAAEIIKLKWRERHPAIVQFWYDLESMAIAAVENPGSTFKAGAHVTFKMAGSFLFCQLPSGRCMVYPYPAVKRTTRQFGKATSTKHALHYYGNVALDAKPAKWAVHSTYGGKLAENVTQAVSRDVLRDAMHRVEAAGYPIAMHVHDELVSERPHGAGSLAEMAQLMAAVPDWAAGLPVAVSGWEGERYRKD